ncbi:MAG: recombination mediator RecR [Patescibacteria group bacterium]|nr:recombination mediator RecR [Patescibacteria group bacterium]
MYSPTIQKLIDLFSKFPTVGPRTAARFVFYLMQKSKEEIEELINSISNLKKNVKICPLCFNSFEGEGEFCQICSHPSRDKSLLCIVANEIDLQALEKTKKYQGFYFILGGTVSRLRKADIEKLRIKELQERIKNQPKIKEIILAFNSTPEGEATTLYLERLLRPLNKKITRLGRGLPVGGELEYADEETLASALEGRK